MQTSLSFGWARFLHRSNAHVYWRKALHTGVCAHSLETGSHSTHQVSLVGNRGIELRKKEKEMQ